MLDLLDKADCEKTAIANDAVDSGIEYLIRVGITQEQFAAIRLDILDIKDPSICVLGQLFNGYDIGLLALSLDFDDQTVCDLGFCGGVIKGTDIDNALLTETWRNKLTEMR